jgi:hypothetical protein
MPQSPRPILALLIAIVLLIALTGRSWLLSTGSVSFHSDEAVVALMARHINAGAPIPTFFYGQAYMGSLDPLLVALAFRLFGESVEAIRLVQSALYLLIVVTGILAAWRLSGRMIVAGVVGLLLAIPSPLVALYTTASLGGYGEVLLCIHLAFYLAGSVFGAADSVQINRRLTNAPTLLTPHSLLLAFTLGVGWWINGLIIAAALPIGAMFLWRLSRSKAIQHKDAKAQRHKGFAFLQKPYAALPTLLLVFMIGSAPWWLYNLTHDWEALRFYLPGSGVAEVGHFTLVEGLRAEPVVEGELPRQEIFARAFGLGLFGFPAVIGLRFPWSSEFFMPLWGALVGLIFVAAWFRLIYRLVRGLPDALDPTGRALMVLCAGMLCAVFVLSAFGADPTGRYLLPLVLPFAYALGAFVDYLIDPPITENAGVGEEKTGRSVERPYTKLIPVNSVQMWMRRLLAVALLLIVVGYQAAGVISASAQPAGLTTQFDPITDLPNTHDAALIAFLDEQGLTRGFTHYWVTYRLAFLSDERLLFTPVLPYKATLVHRLADDRYPAYSAAVREAVESGAPLAFITSDQPELEALLEASFAGLVYQVEQIGVYRVYYGFEDAPPVPETLRLGDGF